MWRYIKDVENPKRKQSPEERKLKDQEYEKKKKHLFLDEWKEGRPWLQFDSESQAMFCDYCMNAGVDPEKSSIVKACTNFKKDAIKSHQYGNSYLYSTNKFLHEQNPKDAPAERAKLSLNKSVSEKLMILFCTVHAVTTEARPLTDYKFITEMDALKGVELPGDRYKTVHSCKDLHRL